MVCSSLCPRPIITLLPGTGGDYIAQTEVRVPRYTSRSWTASLAPVAIRLSRRAIGSQGGDVADESEFLRSARSVWLEIKSDNVEEMTRKILAFGVRKLEVPDSHLYFQAPGGQCLRLVGIDEDLSFYEGTGKGPNVAKVKEALRRMSSP